MKEVCTFQMENYIPRNVFKLKVSRRFKYPTTDKYDVVIIFYYDDIDMFE